MQGRWTSFRAAMAANYIIKLIPDSVTAPAASSVVPARSRTLVPYTRVCRRQFLFPGLMSECTASVATHAMTRPTCANQPRTRRTRSPCRSTTTLCPRRRPADSTRLTGETVGQPSQTIMSPLTSEARNLLLQSLGVPMKASTQASRKTACCHGKLRRTGLNIPTWL